MVVVEVVMFSRIVGMMVYTCMYIAPPSEEDMAIHRVVDSCIMVCFGCPCKMVGIGCWYDRLSSVGVVTMMYNWIAKGKYVAYDDSTCMATCNTYGNCASTCWRICEMTSRLRDITPCTRQEFMIKPNTLRMLYGMAVMAMTLPRYIWHVEMTVMVTVVKTFVAFRMWFHALVTVTGIVRVVCNNKISVHDDGTA
jgi:hypothetical protein